MLLQVRDALEKQNFVSQGDVIEQDRMLVDLSRVADVLQCRLAARHDDAPSRFAISQESARTL